MSMAVSHLITYPIKGCAAVPLSTAELTWAGLEHDRSFMVITVAGGCRTQRRDPKLAIVVPEVLNGGKRLRLTAPGIEALELDVDIDSPPRPVDLFGSPFTGIDQGDDAGGWLSQHLGIEVRLVRVPANHQRVSNGRIPGTSGYADSCAVLMVSRASMDDLNARISARGAEPVPVDRFRPNIVVAGRDRAYAEDDLREVTIGGARLGFAKLAIRCAVTMVDQTTGHRSGPEPIRTLATYRRAEAAGDRGVALGSKFAVLAPGRLAVGDAVLPG